MASSGDSVCMMPEGNSGNDIDRSCAPIRRLSRVSRLRDMFQNGIVQPIEDIDEGSDLAVAAMETFEREEAERFLRTFPGSPPLKTLRNHRASLVKNGPQTDQGLCNKKTNGSPQTPPNGDDSSSNPPTRPPKPRHLFQKQPVPETAETNVMSLREKLRPIPVDLKNSLGLENLGLKDYPSKHEQQSVTNLTATTTTTPEQHSVNSSLRSSNSSLSSHSNRKSDDPTPIADKSSYVYRKSETSDDVEEIRPNQSLNKAVSPISDSGIDVSGRPNQLSSWQGNCALDRINESTVPHSEFQDFILKPDSFHKSPLGTTTKSSNDYEFPMLQHAETVAVRTPDEEDDENELSQIPTNDVMYTSMTSGQLQFGSASLPLPKGLQVVAVDQNGIHIFDDGNFVYALPGLNDHPDTDYEDYDLSDVRESGMDVSKDHHGPMNDSSLKLDTTSTTGLDHSQSDSIKQPRVRFSSEPILVFSTHSTTDYNRRNDDIDPLTASAEYELEKNLEDMELFDVEFRKGESGLGINIVGSGLDTISGDQKLSIFIKALTPGGAAESDGRIQVYDQIVEVDGQSLVGVTQQFAAQALQGTRDIVHFVLARERDPANSRIARILNEKQQTESQSHADNYAPPALTQNSNSEPTCSDNSIEALHKLIAVATQTSSNCEDRDSGDEEYEDQIFESPPKLHKLTSDDDEEDDDCDVVTNYEKPLPEISNGLNGHLPSPSDNTSLNSALKGTATAASTKRRNEAIVDLIRRAACNPANVQIPESIVQNLSTDLLASFPNLKTSKLINPITWVLANQLCECRIRFTKLHSRYLTLEQRLTAQEAAAQEAIERLYLKRIDLEWEVNRLKKQTQAQSIEAVSEQCGMGSDVLKSHFNSNGVEINSVGSGDPNSSQINHMNPSGDTLLHSSINDHGMGDTPQQLPLSTTQHQPISPQQYEQFQSSPTTYQTKCFFNFTIKPDPVNPQTFPSLYSPIPYRFGNSTSNKIDSPTTLTAATDFDLLESQTACSPTSPKVVLPPIATDPIRCSFNQDDLQDSDSPNYLQQTSEHRTRVVSLGSLAGRRRPTRIQINPPPDLLNLTVDPFDNSPLNQSDCSASRELRQDQSTESPCEQTNSDRPPRPIPPTSLQFHSALSSSSASNATPPRPPPLAQICPRSSTNPNPGSGANASSKSTWYQLPGLSQGSLKNTTLRSNPQSINLTTGHKTSTMPDS